MNFEWTLTVGNILSFLALLLSGSIAFWRIRSNDLAHIEKSIETAKQEVLALVGEQSRGLKDGLERIDRDIRELRQQQFRHQEQSLTRTGKMMPGT